MMRLLSVISAIFFVGVSAGPVCPDGVLKDKMVGFAGNAESYLKLTEANVPEMHKFSSCWWLQSYETGEDTQDITYWTYASNDGTAILYANDVKHFEMWINNLRAFGGADFDVRFGLWHHLCFSWDNAEGDYHMYKDGRLLKSGSRFKKGEIVVGGGDLYIGQGSLTGGKSFRGNMASFNLWDKVIDSADVHAIASSYSSSFASGNLISWTCFKESHLVGVETSDTPLKGEPHRDTCEGGEFAGKVLQMDEGAGKFAFVQATQPVPDLKAFTCCAWVKTTEKDIRADAVNYRVKDNAVGSFLVRNPANLRLYVNAKGGKESGVAINDGQWRHLCATWSSDGGVFQYIVGGQVVAAFENLAAGETIAGGGVLILGIGQRRIGANLDWKNKFNFQLADYNLWSTVQSLEDMSMTMSCCHASCGDVISWHAFTSLNLTPDVVVKDSDVPYEEHADM